MHNESIYFNTNNHAYLSRHPEIERFYMPKTYYFRYLPDRMAIHWAIIKSTEGYVNVYFINNFGRVFDKLEFKNVKIARRRLRKCGFDYSTNRYCKETPREPIYIQLSDGRKSAPYSKGNLFQSIQRDRKNPDKYKNSYDKAWRTWHKRTEKWRKKRKTQTKKYKQVTVNKLPKKQTNPFITLLELVWSIILSILFLVALWYFIYFVANIFLNFVNLIFD